jgi:hypothetical protein
LKSRPSGCGWATAAWAGGYFAPQVFLVPGFATVGALVAARRANTVGWLFLGLGSVAALHAFSMAYGERDTLVDPASLPAGSLVGLLAGWLWPLNLLLFCLILLLFPDGRLPSPRWRPAARVILVAWSVSILVMRSAHRTVTRWECRPWVGPPGNGWSLS